MVDVMVENP